ncbi:MAG: hypothetical protein ACRYFS_14885 [Janthinobacterium lividum]
MKKLDSPHTLRLLIALGAAGLLGPAAASAQTPAISFTSDAIGFEDNAADTPYSSYSLGFEFTANSPVFVTSLGYFNDPSYTAPNWVNLSPPQTAPSNFADSHEVGLFQVIPGVGTLPESGLLLASATVTNASTPYGDFAYTSIAPLALIAGDTYVLAGVTGASDPYVYDVQSSAGGVGLLVDPSITYVEDRSAVSDTLTFAGSTDTFGTPGYFGPNLLTTDIAPVPEVSSAVSLGLLLVFGSLAVVVRRRSRSL